MNYRDISKSFIDFAYTQFHAYVKAVRIDNGSIFIYLFHTVEYHRTCVNNRYKTELWYSVH